MAQHEFDIIVYGATSFVGQILTRYMHTQFADGKLKGFVTLTAMAPIFPNRLLRRIQRPSRYSIRSELGI